MPQRPGVVPSRLSISLALADAGLGETQGLDLSAMDARFRGLATGPLRVTRPCFEDGACSKIAIFMGKMVVEHLEVCDFRRNIVINHEI